MKKIFTLCAAFAMVMGVSAAPQLMKAHKSLSNVATQNTLTKVAGQKIAAPGQAYKLNNATSTALRAKAEVIESTYDEISVQDYGTDTWFIATSTDGAYKWYVNPAVAMSDIEFGKVYTMDDMLVSYTYAIDMAAGSYFDFAELECVITEDWKMECKVVSEYGDEYHVYYKALELPAETVDVEVSAMDQVTLSDFIADMGVFQFMGHNSEYEFGLCFESAAVEGSYDADNCYGGWQYTFIAPNGSMEKLYNVEADITKINDTDYAIEATYYAYSGKNYKLHTQFVAPTPENFETITATNLTVDTSMMDLYMAFYGYGVYFINADNADYVVEGACITYDGTVPGHFSTEDGTLNSFTVNGVDMYSGSVDVAVVDGQFAVTGEILCWNSTVYTLDLTFRIPDIEEERPLVSNEPMILTDLTENLGAFQICNADNQTENWISFVFDATEVKSAHFDAVSEAWKDYNYFSFSNELYYVYSCNLDLECNEEDWTLDGECQAGAVLWFVELDGTYVGNEPGPNPDDVQEDTEVSFSAEDIDDFEIYEADGFAYLRAINVERNDVFATLIYIDGSELEAGTYEINDTYAVGTVQAGELYGNNVYPTFYATMTEDGYINLPFCWIVAGTLTVSYDAEGVPSMEVIGSNTNGYNVHVTVNKQATAISNVAAEAQKNGKFMENNNVVIRNNGNKFNGFGMMIK